LESSEESTGPAGRRTARKRCFPWKRRPTVGSGRPELPAGQAQGRHTFLLIVHNASAKTSNATGTLLTAQARRDVVDTVIDEIIGFGPIQPLLNDGEITEIMITPSHIIRRAPRQALQVGTRVSQRPERKCALSKDRPRHWAGTRGRIEPYGGRAASRRLARMQSYPLCLRGPNRDYSQVLATPYTNQDLITFGRLPRRC